MKLFWILFTRFARLIFSLRYKVEIRGLEHLSKKALKDTKGGLFFMPNHPALMDPVFIAAFLWPRFRMRPLVTEYIFRQSLIRPWMKIARGISIPSLTTAVNAFKVKKTKEAIAQVTEGLQKHEHFLLYPGGRLKNGPYETLGGASGAHEILQQCPDAEVVLIRTTGLWGSSFSRAILGVSPDMNQTVLHGIKTILKNGIFFTPRRKVLIEIEREPPNFPRNKSRLEFNRFLEDWYNRYSDGKGGMVKEEPLTLVSYAFWKKDVPQIAEKKEKKAGAIVEIHPETVAQVSKEIRKILNNPKLKVEAESKLTTDLGMDSLNIAETIAFLVQKFDSVDVRPEDLITVQDVLEIAEHATRERNGSPFPQGSKKFPEETKRPHPAAPEGSTISEAFLRRCDVMGSHIACGDDLSGVLSYKRLKKAALVLSSHFKTLPESHIAILLPASCAAYILIFALLLAKKTPVMLNWTLGPRYLDEMMRLSGAKVAISSWKFVEKLSNVDFGSVTDHILFLEDIRHDLSLKTKLKGVALSLLPAKPLLRALDLHRESKDQTAVILFTSGTEASPKGVPLTHQNILANQIAGFQRIPLAATDILYGILPPFHSFGFSVVGLFPILVGVKVAFSPDPTDSFALAEGIERWKITIFCAAPNFIKGLLNVAKPSQLQSVNVFVSGAEKAPAPLLQAISNVKKEIRFIEGYGITECAPILSTTNMEHPSKVGKSRFLEGIEACTIHPETHELLEVGAEGEICVRGENVFHGYLGSVASPFIELGGKKWYRTGDIGSIDAAGYLVLSGRLKRFTKLGGEMVSLGAIEEILSAELLKQGQGVADGPNLAVCAIEKPDQKPEIVVFTTSPSLSKEKANAALLEAGCSRLIKITEVKQIAEMPLLGTGKTNYRQLQTLITA